MSQVNTQPPVTDALSNGEDYARERSSSNAEKPGNRTGSPASADGSQQLTALRVHNGGHRHSIAVSPQHHTFIHGEPKCHCSIWRLAQGGTGKLSPSKGSAKSSADNVSCEMCAAQQQQQQQQQQLQAQLDKSSGARRESAPARHGQPLLKAHQGGLLKMVMKKD